MKITLREVAAAAKVSVSAASRALADKPGVGAKTAERVRAVAARLGWTPDPLLSALASYRRPRRRRICIGHVVGDEATPYRQASRDGVAARARELGYLVECIAPGAPDLEQRLERRGITAVILQAEELSLVRLPDLARRACVQLLGDPSAARWPTVSTNHFQDLETALTRIATLGYQRPRLMLPAWFAGGAGRDSLGAWRYFAGSAGGEPFHWQPGAEHALLGWWRTQRPDCLLYSGPRWPIDLLASHGVRLPEDAGYVSLDLPEPDGELTNIWSDRPRLGALTVDLLHARLTARDAGLHERPAHVAVAGRWCDGRTLPRR